MSKRRTTKGPGRKTQRETAKASNRTEPDGVSFRVVGGVDAALSSRVPAGMADPVRQAALETATAELRKLATSDVIALTPVLARHAVYADPGPAPGGGSA